MKIIKNKLIPCSGFRCINLCGVLFTRGNRIDTVTITHESIHTLQMKEMFYVPFYLWYAIEFLYRLFKLKNAKEAYKNISFEKEAYMYELFSNYPAQREEFAWRKFL